MRLPKIQVEKIKKALKHIKKDFRRFDMGGWGSEVSAEDYGSKEEAKKHVPPCGTRACLGGWLYLLDAKTKKAMETRRKKLFRIDDSDDLDIEEVATKIAGFTDNEAARVFVGRATEFHAPSTQYEILREELNKVFEERGLKVKV